MRALRYHGNGEALRLDEIPAAAPAVGQVRVAVRACGVCRTDLHLVDDELDDPRLPVVPGHEIVGVVESLGAGVEGFEIGQRVGIPWLGWTCGECSSCRQGDENLCDQARFTGLQIDGGYAEYAVADARFCFPLASAFDAMSDIEIAPLLCAGLIGHRAYRMAGDAQRVGLYGFGAAAHIVAQVAVHEGREVFAFTRPGDLDAQRFARSLGARWAGGSDRESPVALDAALLFAPVGALVPAALRSVRKGGRVVCAGIHMSEIPAFPYALLWGERSIRSVANLTRADAREFLEIAPRIPIRAETVLYDLEEGNRALQDLRTGRLTGAAVLQVQKAASSWHSDSDDRESHASIRERRSVEPEHFERRFPSA